MVMQMEKLDYATKDAISHTMKVIKDIRAIHPMKHPACICDASDDLLRAALQFEQVVKLYGIK